MAGRSQTGYFKKESPPPHSLAQSGGGRQAKGEVKNGILQFRKMSEKRKLKLPWLPFLYPPCTPRTGSQQEGYRILLGSRGANQAISCMLLACQSPTPQREGGMANPFMANLIILWKWSNGYRVRNVGCINAKERVFWLLQKYMLVCLPPILMQAFSRLPRFMGRRTY